MVVFFLGTLSVEQLIISGFILCLSRPICLSRCLILWWAPAEVRCFVAVLFCGFVLLDLPQSVSFA